MQSNSGYESKRRGEQDHYLLIDNDPQGSLTESLGFNKPDELDGTLATMIAELIKPDDNLSRVAGAWGKVKLKMTSIMYQREQ